MAMQGKLKSVRALCGSLLAFFVSEPSANLLHNPGFEDAGLPGWYLSAPYPDNHAEVVTDKVHSGQRSVRLTANTPEVRGRSVQVISDSTPIPGSALIEASLWIMAESVDRCGTPDIDGCQNWHQLRVTLYAYDSNNTRITPHWDLLSTDGDVCTTGNRERCDWKHLKFSLITPGNATSMRIAVSLTSSTGTVWVDDIELKVLATIPEPVFSALSNPIVIPPPTKMIKGNDDVSLGSVSIRVIPGDDRIRQAISDFFQKNLVVHEFDTQSSSTFTTELLMGDHNTPEVRAQFAARFPDHQWAEMGNEGYFISVDQQQRTRIIVGAATENGRFHALQTLKQLVNNDRIHFVDIMDMPTNERRGIAFGLPWLSKDYGATAIERVAERKGNLIWMQGNHMSGALTWNWREPFNSEQLVLMSNLHTLSDQNFLDMHISFGPRTQRTSLGCNTFNYPTPVFSSPQEIDALVNKMLAMYVLGYRNFGINFDDVDICGEDVLRHQEDKEKFSNDIALAHVYFVNQVYSRLRSLHQDIRFAMVPLWYTRTGSSSIAREDYVAALKLLHPDIGLLTVQVTDENIHTFSSLAQRPTMLWSNFYADLKGTVYTLPFISELTWDPAWITGFLFLPAMPDTDTWNEDQALVSWNSALSYAWSPHAYDALAAYKLSGARYEGVADPVPAVSIPIVSPNGGIVPAGQPITLSTTTPLTDIYYTLDGTVPTNHGHEDSVLYRGPFELLNSATLTARAYRAGFIDSPVVSSYLNTAPRTHVDSSWIDDNFPDGATQDGGWIFAKTSPAPYSGEYALQSGHSTGMHQHYFINAAHRMVVDPGDILYAYVYLDPLNPPSQIMLQWHHGGGWNHRAYWGTNNLDWGIEGTNSRRFMGPLPAAGTWVRLEVPASSVGLEGTSIGGMAFTLYAGSAMWDNAGVSKKVTHSVPSPSDLIWLDDAVPAGSVQEGAWTFSGSHPTPFLGLLSHQSGLASGIHQSYFYNAPDRLVINAGESLIAYVYLDPEFPPREIMLQWRNGSSWNHRAYWGEDLIPWGFDGTDSRRHMGALPATGQWVRLEVPANLVGLENKAINGAAFTLYDGRANWDYVGKMQ